ncbi:MAG TPA: condensation domain-containing protein, partial [Puia sp.]|nr:condensation domain-containing protein [Puia sp.]
TLPIRYRIDPYRSFNDLVMGVNDHFVQAGSNQIYDLSDMLVQLNRKEDRVIKDLFNVLFVFQNFNENRNGKDSEAFVTYDIEKKTAKYPLMLIAEESGDSFALSFEYSVSHFTPADMTLLIVQFRALVAKLIARPDLKLIDIVADGALFEVGENDIVFNF